MVTGFDIWGHDAGLRRHWKGRFAAFAIDAAISFIPVSAVLYLIDITDIAPVGLLSSLIFYLASSVPESLTGASAGKRIMGFRVHNVRGEGLVGKVCLRNIPRAFWFVLPPLDFAVGMATRGDPREKLFDRLAGTRVVHSSETEKHEKALNNLSEAEGSEISGKDSCRGCHGNLVLLPDQKLQCEKCGLIQ